MFTFYSARFSVTHEKEHLRVLTVHLKAIIIINMSCWIHGFPISLLTLKTAGQYISLLVIGTGKKPPANPQPTWETWNHMSSQRSHALKITYCVFLPMWISRKGKTLVTERRWVTAWESGGAAKMHRELLGWHSWVWKDHRLYRVFARISRNYIPKTDDFNWMKIIL